MLLHYLHTGTYSYLGTKGSVISDHNEFFDSLKDFFALSLRVQGSTSNKKSLGKKVFKIILYLSIFDIWFRKKTVYLRYGPTFLGKMFLKFSDDRIKIIDSHYLVWNYTHSKTKQNINYMIQVKSPKILVLISVTGFFHTINADKWSILGWKKININIHIESNLYDSWR